MVPHLVTALNGPINELEQRMLEATPAIERWFRLEWMEHTPAFYCAVDVRNAGYKLAPVDTGLFPSRFNNLAPEVMPLAVQAAMAAIEKICPEARNLLIIPETGNRNSFYLESLHRLIGIFYQAGLNVRLGSLDPALKKPTHWRLPEGQTLAVEPVVRQRGRVGLKDFDPCTILLNTPLMEGVPKQLLSVHEQYLLPPLHAGWTVRSMGRHFQIYEEVAKKFSKLLGMDHWLIHPITHACGPVNLDDALSLKGLADQVDAVLTKVRRKHKEYGIADKPFVVIKAGDRRHGLASLNVRDAKDLAAKIERARIPPQAEPTSSSQGVELVVQEGVPTFERINEAVAEPVVYTMDRYVVGGYYRVHAEPGHPDQLHPANSHYVPLAFEPSGALPRPGVKPGVSAPNRFYMYGVVARLALLAASYELEATDPESDSVE